MSLFTILTDAKAIVRNNGSYYQLDMYQRNGRVYIKHGSAFHSLRQKGGTSKPSFVWEELVWDHKESYDSLGRMVITDDPTA